MKSKNLTEFERGFFIATISMKLVLIFLALVLLVGTVSAVEWNDRLIYSNNDLKVSLDNWWGLGETIGTVELKSHSSVDEVKGVQRGKQVVMWYEFNFGDTYKDGLGEVKFKNMWNGNFVNKNYKFVYWKEEVCNKFSHINGTKYNKCSFGEWLDYNSKDIPKGKITIGIMVDVNRKDYFDGIWNIGGKEISRHAEWTDLGSESNPGASGTATTLSLTSTFTAISDFGYISALGFQAGAGTGDSIYQIHINQSGSNLATGIILVPVSQAFVYMNLTSVNYSAPITAGSFTINYNAITGDSEMAFASDAFSGSLFNYSTQNVNTRLTTGSAITFTEVQLRGVNITLNSPVEAFNSSIQLVTFNTSAIATSSNAVKNVSLHIDGIINETNSSGVNGTYIFTKNIADGSHNWSIIAFDNVSVKASSETRNFTIDSTGPTLNLTFPNKTLDLHVLNTNLSINWTVSDLNLDTCLLEYEGVNQTVTCLDNQTGINITNNINKSIIFYVNDTFGNTNSSTISWDYTVFENNQTFNEVVFEGSLETFTANLLVDGSNSVSSAKLYYNGTPNAGSFTNSLNNYILTKELLIPQVNLDTIVTFVWNVELSGGQSINITPHNQTITSITLDDCSLNTIVVYNYTMVDEGNQTKLFNTSAEFNINILDQKRINNIINFSKTYTDINPFAVCINLDIASTIYSVDSVVKYQASGYVIEYYNIVNSSLTNSTIPINITLFDLASLDSTGFKISFKGEDFVFVENALIFIDRQYISENNTFKTVELPKTDSNGKTVGHFVRNDVVYNIRVIKEGVILGNFNNIIAFCQDFTIGDCQIVLEATPSSQSTFNYNSELGIIFQVVPTYNNDTKAVSFSYSTDDGTPKTVFLEVTRNDIFGNRTLCNNTVTSASGTLSCSINPNIDETKLVTKVYVDGKLTILSNIVLDNASIYGNLAYTLWFFLTFVFILGFGTSKTEVLIGLVVSIIGAISLGLVRGDIVGLGSAGIWMIVIVLLGIWKLNKENPQ